jgi:hypothetical protein
MAAPGEERTLFHNDGVRLTDRQLVLEGISVPLLRVRSARAPKKNVPTSGARCAAVGAGLCLALFTFAFFMSLVVAEHGFWHRFWIISALVSIVLGVGALTANVALGDRRATIIKVDTGAEHPALITFDDSVTAEEFLLALDLARRPSAAAKRGEPAAAAGASEPHRT